MQSYWAYPLFGSVIGILAVLIMLLRRQLTQQRQRLQIVQNDLRALCNAAVAVGERVNRIERNQHQLSERQNELGQRQERLGKEDTEEYSFAQAVKMAQKGASAEELVDICGLTQGEAELVAMMHRLGDDAH